jgi:hypothetical protein
MHSPKPSKYLSPELPFRLESLVATSRPDGSEGDWYRYVISQGTNLITGLRCGPESEVKAIIADMIERLNERREGKTRPKTKSIQSTSQAASS